MLVIGAGPAGLAAAAALERAGVAWAGIDRAPELGGKWRGDGTPVWPGLRLNTSRRQTGFHGVPVPGTGAFARGEDLLAHLKAFADRHGLRERYAFGEEARRAAPDPDRGGWAVETAAGTRAARAVVLAVGVHDRPRVPELPGDPTIPVEHTSRFRHAAPFAGRRVLVVGLGTSGAEVAAELGVAGAEVLLACRRGGHLVPTAYRRRPIDWLDGPASSRLPWSVQRTLLEAVVRGARGAAPGLPRPARPLFHEQPVLSTRLAPLLRAGRVRAVGALEAIDGRVARLAGGAAEPVDHVFLATGYHADVPLLGLDPWDVGGGERRPLYRRIAPVRTPGLLLVGAVEPLGGLLPVVEEQGRWVAAVLAGRIALPPAAAMLAAVRADDARLLRRFGETERRLLLCDRHPYRRRLRRDRLGIPRGPREALAPLAGLKAA